LGFAKVKEMQVSQRLQSLFRSAMARHFLAETLESLRGVESICDGAAGIRTVTSNMLKESAILVV
jgi:hypothetical protein